MNGVISGVMNPQDSAERILEFFKIIFSLSRYGVPYTYLNTLINALYFLI